MSRSQLSMELEEGRAAFMLGVPYTSNPYRKPEAQHMERWDEAARNWESGWKAAEGKSEHEKLYSDDFKRCDCGSETFARFEVYANPTITVRVHTACGNSWVTRINATEEQARSYFVGKWFNLGTEEDQTVRVVLLEVVSDA